MTDEQFPILDNADTEAAVDAHIDLTVRESPLSILTTPSFLSGLR